MVFLKQKGRGFVDTHAHLEKVDDLEGAPEPLGGGGPPKLTSRLSSTIRTRLEERNRRVFKPKRTKKC